jgi:hypothetical protein
MPKLRIPTSFTAGRRITFGEALAVVATPVLTKGATVGAGGAFGAGSVFWVLTAVDADGGESVASNEVTAVLVADGSQVLDWVAVPGASYKLYRGTVEGSWTKRVAVIAEGVTTYTDLGNPGTSANPPTVATTSGESIWYNLGDVIPNATVKAIKHVSALLSRRWIIPNWDFHYRKTLSTTPTPTDVSPPSVRKAI